MTERYRAALERIKSLKAAPIGDTGFQTGPLALFNAAQSLARTALTEDAMACQPADAPPPYSEAEVEALRELSEKASLGPWYEDGRTNWKDTKKQGDDAICIGGVHWGGFARVVARLDHEKRDSAEGIANAALIVAAVNDVRKRLATLRSAAPPPPAPRPYTPEQIEGAFTSLRAANTARQALWANGEAVSLLFRATELGGETGEVLNVVKKIERERAGWRGSRATVADLANELADVVICADLLALTEGIDLDAAIVAKFNATSEKVGLPTRLATLAPPTEHTFAEPSRPDGSGDAGGCKGSALDTGQSSERALPTPSEPATGEGFEAWWTLAVEDGDYPDVPHVKRWCEAAFEAGQGQPAPAPMTRDQVAAIIDPNAFVTDDGRGDPGYWRDRGNRALAKADAILSLASPAAGDGWRPIESAPRNHPALYFGNRASWSGGFSIHAGEDPARLAGEGVTHWRPLPLPPPVAP